MAGHVTISRQMQQRMTPFILFVWVLTCAIWSTVWLFIKLGVRDVPPAAFAVYRMAIALAVLVPVIVLRRTPWPRGRSEWVVILSTGFILLGVNYALLNWGIQFISSGLTAVLQAMTPVFGFVFAHALLHDERMSRVERTGAGAWGRRRRDHLLGSDGRRRGRPILGSVAVTASAACVAVAYVVMKRRGASLDPSVILTGQLLAGAVPLAVYSRIVEGTIRRLAVDPDRASLGSVSRPAGFGGRWVAQLLAAETDRRDQAFEHGTDRTPDRGTPRSGCSSRSR